MDKDQAERLIKALERIAAALEGSSQKAAGSTLCVGSTPFRGETVIASPELMVSTIGPVLGLRESGPA